MNCLEIDNVELNFDQKSILKAIYFKAEKGNVTGILGSNGCGKTSLLRIIFGELKPNNKLIRIDKKPVLKPLYTLGFIKFLPQFSIIPNSFSLKKCFYHFNVSLSDFLTEFTEFTSKKGMLFRDFSGGEKRVIETYLIVKSAAKIILLDEPFSHIAPLYIEKIKAIINIEKKDKIFIITDHLYRDILQISDDIYFMKEGWMKPIKNYEDLIFHKYTNTL